MEALTVSARIARISSWLHGATVAEQAREAPAGRALFDAIGAFLFAHGLAPSPENFRIAHDHLSGRDPALSAAIGALLEGGAIDDDAFARVGSEAPAEQVKPDALLQLAEALEARIADCAQAVDLSHRSAERYGAALGSAADTLAADPAGAVQSLIGVTREVLDTTRIVTGQLARTRGETDRLRASLRRVQRVADRDHLTGIANRRSFEARLKTVPEASGRCVALCDIDNFKTINDRHGHDAGDRVLRFVARFLQQQLAPDGFVARYGGEEFACVFDRANADAAHAAIDAARAALIERSLRNRATDAVIGNITFSAGIAPVVTTTRAALRDADRALYGAKRDGKNRVVVAASVREPQRRAF